MAALPAERNERLSAIGEMTAEFAHQVRTPLASAMLYTAQLDTSTSEQKRVVEKIQGRLNDLGRMVNDMLGFAAGARPVKERILVGDLLDAVVRTIEPQLAPTTILTVRCDSTAMSIMANKEALKGAILNLVSNAEQACVTNAAIELTARRYGDRVLISVGDNGPGIQSQCVGRLFEPFYTTRPEGTGLGLAVVQAVTRSHNGSVSVDTSGEGSCFTLDLPVLAVAGIANG
ncbi:MAG: HAMP domain-containing sensor histidine kinase [Woeseiaceae bacterium]|nr:HAMP domain-containing sensor histidine kinase [Woeseiaceae bacterium]